VNRKAAAVGSALFFGVAPGTVAGVIPYWLTGWVARPAPDWWMPIRMLGFLLIAAGSAVLVTAFVRFVIEGAGTPAPVAPPEHLVVGGLYRYVRNPMYLAVVTAILGQAMLLAQPVLLLYAAVVAVAMVAFVLGYEQPALTRRYGTEYLTYRRAVPPWWPRRPRSRL
jgi:protein-S-isoprenylcysteine O-methyltransferase Ste14